MVSRVHHLRCTTTVMVLSSKEVYQCLRHSLVNKRRVLGSSSNSVPLLCSNLKLQFRYTSSIWHRICSPCIQLTLISRVRRLFSNQRPLDKMWFEDLSSSYIYTCAALLLSRNLIKSWLHDYCISYASKLLSIRVHIFWLWIPQFCSPERTKGIDPHILRNGCWLIRARRVLLLKSWILGGYSGGLGLKQIFWVCTEMNSALTHHARIP